MPLHASARASGKIILSGEYAVLFGGRGIAIPSQTGVTVEWTENATMECVLIVWEKNANPTWIDYARSVLHNLETTTGNLKGTLMITNDLPLGKGMGSSTALIVAICRCLVGPDCAKIALRIENALSPDNSGIDFAVIWEEKPVLFKRNEVPALIDFDVKQLEGSTLIDSGAPNEPTPELVAWIRSEKENLKGPLANIGECTERLLKGESLFSVLRDHHRAQVALGVVTPSAKAIIAMIEADGGAAKVIGAGGRTGGSGMILALPARSS